MAKKVTPFVCLNMFYFYRSYWNWLFIYDPDRGYLCFTNIWLNLLSLPYYEEANWQSADEMSK